MWIINTLRRPGNLTLAVILAASMFSVQACGGSSASPDAAMSDAVIGGGVDSSGGAALAAGWYRDRTLVTFPDRPYSLLVPTGAGPHPLLFILHGGAGNAASAETMTCSSSDVDNPSCLHNLAAAAGMVVVFPNGTSSAALSNVRTFNAGGGGVRSAGGNWVCVSGAACTSGVDELPYFNALLAEVSALTAVDDSRLFATGLSNGGAMSHRLACSWNKLRAIAAVGGANQFETMEACNPQRKPAVLHIHGDADPCWSYTESATACGPGESGYKVGVVASTLKWAIRNGCRVSTGAGPASTPMPNPANDGMTSERLTWANCAAPTELIRVGGGGHLYPNGFLTIPSSTVGRATQDFGNEVIMDFFNRAP
jgi:polyhydroxybutyrate depolymerase